ncbi:MAG: 5'-nucleotidase C-terminal domain-containing protein [Azospirillaceae bacterium]
MLRTHYGITTMQHRRLRSSLTLGTSLCALLLATPVLAQDLREAAGLTIFHINDIYIIDNFPELMTLIEEGSAGDATAIVTVGGDFLSPSLLSGLDQGQNMITMFNSIGVDYAVFGNHEFDFGPDIAAERIAESEFPWLGTNVLGADGEPFGGSVAYEMFEAGPYTVGLFGVLTPETAELSSPGENVEITDIYAASEEAVAYLQEQGADVIIALTHLTIADDRALAASIDGIDVILGGHDHDPMSIFENGVLIHKSGSDGEFLGTIHLAISESEGRDGPVVDVAPTSWEVATTSGVTGEASVQEIVDDFNQLLDEQLGVVIGTTETDLVSLRGSVRTEETTFGNLIADAMRAGVDADIAITNGGGIRGDTTYPAGSEITRRDVLTELPFGNVTVLMELSGADVRTALENGVSQVEDVAGRFPQVSGLAFTWDPAAAPGSRVVEVTVGGEPLDDSATYRLATNDYMAGGGDGYAAFTNGDLIIDASGATLMATMVSNYIEDEGTVAPTVEGRITRAE